MGDLIKFPIQPKPPENEMMDRARRIQAALERINELMRKLKDGRDIGRD